MPTKIENYDLDDLDTFCFDVALDIQYPPLNRITLGQLKSDNNDRMIQ